MASLADITLLLNTIVTPMNERVERMHIESEEMKNKIVELTIMIDTMKSAQQPVGQAHKSQRAIDTRPFRPTAFKDCTVGIQRNGWSHTVVLHLQKERSRQSSWRTTRPRNSGTVFAISRTAYTYSLRQTLRETRPYL